MSAFLYMRVVILLALSRVVKSKRLSFEFHKQILNQWRNENSKVCDSFLHQSSNASKGTDIWLSLRYATINVSILHQPRYIQILLLNVSCTNWHTSEALRYAKSLFEQCNAFKSAYWMTKLMQKSCNWLLSYFYKKLSDPSSPQNFILRHQNNKKNP